MPLFAAVLASCGFVDLRPIAYTVVPERPDTVLPGEYSPVILCFDSEMDKQATEGIIKISSIAGLVEGDLSWHEHRLFFAPVPGWTAGTRYALSISGLARSVDGRELRIEKNTFFYAINKSAPPVVEWFSPFNGASVGTGSDEGLAVEIHFSRPMERLSTEKAFTLDGAGDRKFEWSDDDKVFRVAPEKNLSPWMDYNWSLKGSAKSRDGVPLAKTVSARFSTDKDRLMPKVARVFPMISSNGRWFPTGGGIEADLGPGQGIAIEFNKPMAANALLALRFEPSLAGRSEQLSENIFVYIPSRDPEPETEYVLIISADAKDGSGLKLGEDFQINFIADIPYLRILSFTVDGVPGIVPESGNMSDGPALAVPVDVEGLVRFTIRFSLPFNLEAKQNTALKISLSPFFPGTLPPVALRFAEWLSDDRLRMEWEGLRSGNVDEPHYFKLLFPGGKGGIDSGDGMHLKEDQYILLEAQ
jgi:hypothetical protein